MKNYNINIILINKNQKEDNKIKFYFYDKFI